MACNLNHISIVAILTFYAFPFSQSMDNSTITSDSSAELVTQSNAMNIKFDKIQNSRTDTVDGVLFMTSTDRKVYASGDSVRVTYRIKNRTMGTVLYDFNTTCQFDLQFVDRRGHTVYSLLSVKACAPDSSRIQLSSSTEKTVTFDPVPLSIVRSDSLTVRAQMAGYPLSAVPVKIRCETDGSATAVVALEGGSGHKPVLEFNHETKMLVIRVDHAQRLTISAFILTGQKLNKLSVEKFLEPGAHLISFNNKKLTDGVVVFKVEGSGVSESKTINLSR
jgi:hypothetical protein